MKLRDDIFYRSLCELYSYFGKTMMPTKERALLLFVKVRHIDDALLMKAFSKMQDDLDILPQNIPKSLRSMVAGIQASDPAYCKHVSFKPHKFGHCEDCNGCGIFKVRLKVDNLFYEQIKYCSECDNWRQWVNDPGTRTSKQELINFGITHKPYTVVVENEYFKNIVNEKYNPKTVNKQLQNLANKAFKRINDV